ncbi:MAG: hypothetical protein P8M32_04950 [Phycisphaerales bacterium]|nr:hypothetical protein [Phycisphaerales bacterium]
MRALLIATVSSVLCSHAAASWSADQGPPWRAADAALMIEAVNITDADRQQMLTLLIEDFSVAWQALTKRYASQFRPPRIDPARWHEAFHAALAAEEDANALLGDLSKSSAREALRINNRIVRLREQADEFRNSARAIRKSQATEAARTAAQRDAIWDAFQRDATSLEAIFVSDARQLLDPSERSAFDTFIETITRRRQLNHAMLEGESLDLDAVIDSLVPPLSPAESAAVELALQQWRIDIDARLAARSEFEHPRYQERARLAEAGGTQEDSPRSKSQLHAAEAVRDCTLMHLKAVVSTAGSYNGPRIWRVAMAWGYPQLSKPSVVELAIAWCIQNRPSDADLLASLSHEHSARLAALRTKGTHAEASIAAETNRAIGQLQQLVGSARAGYAMIRGAKSTRDGSNFPLHK